MGLFRYLSSHTDNIEARQTSIILLSDMQDVRSGKWNFENNPPALELLRKWEKQGLIENLQNLNVYVFSCGPAHGISNEHYDQIRDFWQAYFKKSRANLLAYGYERDISRVLPKEERPLVFSLFGCHLREDGLKTLNFKLEDDMATVAHIAVGMAAGRWYVGPSARAWPTMSGLAMLFILPDLDVIGYTLGIPYGAPFGHRGALHSLVAAMGFGLLASVIALSWRKSFLKTWGLATLVVASHGLLDAFTTGGLGVAFFWPFSQERYFAPWRPIPVASLGLAILSERGLQVVLQELILCLPY